ncbi:MAG: MBL fold metallo-hydrolase [Armatimonadota bacterium]|nr:MBL fold metallo-hydrolase [Armatimonadota bacterium]MDR7519366.1 MBL fold metallo-hydrolase [Armatimonadota bacterium]MDR7549511.1 MBL fold metallo-hydrolase [Armatimonadota bacterium]
MPRIERLADDLVLIDTDYEGTPQAIGAYLLTGDRPALIETGPASTVETLLDGVQAAGVEPEHLQALAVTHIHLDHAGATGTLVRRFPHLEVYVHPVGAPHLADPSRLVSSARRLYGADLERLFGEVAPVPHGRIRAISDGAEVLLGSRRLAVFDTPGHARHHVVYFDRASKDLFTGDAAGVALPGSRYVRPPTPPPELDVPAWDATIGRLRGLGVRRLLLTHFGAHTWVEELLAQLQQRLHAAVELVRVALEDGANDEAIAQRMRNVMAVEAARLDGPDRAARFETIMSTRLSALGLIRYLKTR